MNDSIIQELTFIRDFIPSWLLRQNSLVIPKAAKVITKEKEEKEAK